MFVSMQSKIFIYIFVILYLVHPEYTFAKGDEYAGQFKNGKPHGYGSYTWSIGDKYVGTWKNHKKKEILSDKPDFRPLKNGLNRVMTRKHSY